MSQTPVSQTSIIRTLIVDPHSINQDLICVICLQLVVNPKECSQCHTLFCSECIQESLIKNKICPKRCKEDFKVENINRIVKNLISQIKIKCLNKGCDQQMQIQNLDSHLKQCEYVLTKCQYTDCNLQDSLKNIKVHQQLCNHRTKTCEKCEEIHKINQQHDCIVTLRKIVKLQEDLIMVLYTRLDWLETQQQCFQVKQQLKWVFPPKIAQCSQCKKENLKIRYVCEQSGVSYCQRCMRPKLKYFQCPLNHDFIESYRQKVDSKECDFCGTQIVSKNYYDQICDLILCRTCYYEN
ncbi:unnamed protein product [Paramecium pentaurelia]|uniref:RING-type domain-containing protein n=1 Tax=Paramecium pentaurelia TaxID=43138 RepID=A0A8S1Y2C1_9CILI|nr:unnamed protein product [Paramecium pentaurelia]